MRRLTIREVNEHHGGILPPDATYRPDDHEEPTKPVSTTKPKHRNRSDRFAMLNAFTDIAMAGLTGAETKVWLILFRDTKATTGTARTGQTDIARRAGIDVRTARRVLVTFEAKGMIRVIRKGRLNAGPSIYRVHPTGTA